ncbi:hypothetical protein JCM11251_000069 [Rhodosporidiobolus azoricus]
MAACGPDAAAPLSVATPKSRNSLAQACSSRLPDALLLDIAFPVSASAEFCFFCSSHIRLAHLASPSSTVTTPLYMSHSGDSTLKDRTLQSASEEVMGHV